MSSYTDFVQIHLRPYTCQYVLALFGLPQKLVRTTHNGKEVSQWTMEEEQGILVFDEVVWALVDV